MQQTACDLLQQAVSHVVALGVEARTRSPVGHTLLALRSDVEVKHVTQAACYIAAQYKNPIGDYGGRQQFIRL